MQIWRRGEPMQPFYNFFDLWTKISFNEKDIGAPKAEEIMWLELLPDHFQFSRILRKVPIKQAPELTVGGTLNWWWTISHITRTHFDIFLGTSWIVSFARSSCSDGVLLQICSSRVFTHPRAKGHNSCSKSLQQDQCNSQQLRATHTMHATPVENKQTQQSTQLTTQTTPITDHLTTLPQCTHQSGH